MKGSDSIFRVFQRKSGKLINGSHVLMSLPKNEIKFSVVVPAFNEEAFLPRLLDSVEVAKSQYSGGPGTIEVIVADNCSTDRTAEVAARRGARVVRVEKRRIAAARNGGARAAA